MADILLNHYIVRQVLAPSGNGLLANAVALTIKNVGTQTLAFIELSGQTLFTGTNAASGSLWGAQRVTATPASGTLVTPFKCHPNGAAPSANAEVRFSDTGTITGVTVDQPIAYHWGIASQVGSNTVPPLFGTQENPLALIAPGDCLAVYALTAIVAGSRASIHIEWNVVP